MIEMLQTRFSLIVSTIGLAILMALLVARVANSEPALPAPMAAVAAEAAA